MSDTIRVRFAPSPKLYACGVEFSEVIKRRKMIRGFTGEPLAPGITERFVASG